MVSTSTTDAFPGFSDLFYLHDPLGRGAFRAELELDADLAVAAMRGEIPLPVVRARRIMGSDHPDDVVHTTSVGPVLLSERTVDVLRANDVSGWEVTPCLWQDDAARAQYFFLIVRGRCGPLDETRSIPFDQRYPKGDVRRWRGWFFEPSTWDGTDLFMAPPNHRAKFVTGKVKRSFEADGITGAKFTRLDQVEYDRSEFRT